MLNFKKIMLSACAMVITLTAAIASASAAYDVDIVQSTKKAKNDYTYIRVQVPGIATTTTSTDANYILNSEIHIKVQKGLFTKAATTEITKTEVIDDEYVTTLEGLQLTSDNSSPTWLVKLRTDMSDEYDVIQIGAANPAMVSMYAPCGSLLDVKLTYADATAMGDAEMSILPSSYISTCKVDRSNVTNDAAFNANPYVYTLASGTNTITKAEPSVGPTKEVKALDYFTGDKLEEDDNADTSDLAAAVYAQLIPADADTVYTKVNWSVTATEDGTANTAAKAKSYEQAVNVSGEAAYKFGLVIRGLAANVITAVDAALAQ